MNEQEIKVRSQLIPLENLRLVLPNTAIAEVISFQKAEAAENTPNWVAGFIRWRGLRIPLVSFELATINQTPQIHRRNRIIVLNALNSSEALPFYGLTAQGIPRLMNLDSSNILDAPNAEIDHPFVLRQVLVEGHTAVIPQQNALETAMAEAGLRVHPDHAQAV